MWRYTVFLTVVFILPAVILAITFRERLRGSLQTYLISLGVAFLFGVPLEYYFIVGYEVLYHPESSVIGVTITGIPIEAFFFYVAITVLIVTLTLILYRGREGS